MKKYEYLYEIYDHGRLLERTFEQFLSDYGELGWELVVAERGESGNHHLIFKRELE
jgi:hypothetical protein